ncbi:MAG: hypothetical protein K2H38_07540 [Muribaculaceae bacterium]|nr:hypothetical protein [Muribaculaceae bacterium]
MNKMKTFAYRMLAAWCCLMALMLGGCVKNEFKVDFEFPKDHLGNYLMTYYAWDSRGGRWIEHTASIQEGVATADCITRLPTLIYISDASHPGNSMIIYAERGDRIKVSGEGNDMGAWTVTGNKLSERWSEWRKTAYPKKGDSKAFEKCIEEYVKENPKDELSAILLLTEWNRRENPEGFVRLWNMVSKGARGQQLIEMCGATDLLGVQFTTTADGNLEYAKDAKMKHLLLRSRDNGLDTLKFNKASILYFYVENNSERREVVDSLKVLTKAYSDSAKRIMADIYMDSDSMTWVNAIRRDSLKGVVRAWQPRGTAEGDMVKMGVTRLPWFIVKDKAGKEIYAGDDLKKAMAEFRKTAGKPDAKSSKDKPKTEAKDADKPKAESASSQSPAPKGSADSKSLPRPGQSADTNPKKQPSKR